MRDADPRRSRNYRKCAYLDIFSAGAASGDSRASEERTGYRSRRAGTPAGRLSQFEVRRDGLQRIDATLSAGVGDCAHRDRALRSLRRHVSKGRDHSHLAVDHPPGSALASRSAALRSRALDAGGSRVTPKVFLLPFWCRSAAMHRRILCLDGRRAVARQHRTEVEVLDCAADQSGTHAPHYIAAEARNEIAGGTAKRLNRGGMENTEVCVEVPTVPLSLE